KRFKEDFEGLLAELESYGYNNYWQVLNAKDYGIPQNRERVFIVSIKKDVDKGYEFPKGFDNGLRLKDLLEDEVEDKYYIDNDRTSILLNNLKEQDLLNGERFGADSSINEPKERKISNCITARYDNGIHNQKQRGLVVVEPILIGGMQKNQSIKRDGISTTLVSAMGTGGGNVPMIVASRGRNPSNPSDRTVGSTTEQRLEPNSQGLCNTLTTVQKDNLVLEPNELKFVGGIGEKDWVGDGKEYSRNYPQGNRVYDVSGIACSQTAQGGGIGSVTGLYLEEKTANELQLFTNLKGGKWNKIHESARRVYDEEGIAPTIPTCGGGNIEPKVQTNYRIRKLTPKECWRLMGFTDEDYHKARQALEDRFYNGKDRSNSQMYKMAGNSIVVDVLEAIFKE
ncbi:MAG TPA: DNA cytosine methyltransferase, partial [Tissierellaceae bacterium]|nr:DNA cytosine methyltransferase [Tissierellaceae bacterium]